MLSGLMCHVACMTSPESIHRDTRYVSAVQDEFYILYVHKTKYISKEWSTEIFFHLEPNSNWIFGVEAVISIILEDLFIALMW